MTRAACTCRSDAPRCPACTAWHRHHPHKRYADRVPDADAPAARPGRTVQSRADLLERLLTAEKQLASRHARGDTAAKLWGLRRRIGNYQARLAAWPQEERQDA